MAAIDSPDAVMEADERTAFALNRLVGLMHRAFGRRA